MVRSDTVAVIGRSLEFEIIKSKKTIPLLAKMLDVDPRTIYKGINSESVSPVVIRKFSKFFNVPVSFFTDAISDNDIVLKPIISWQNYFMNSQIDSDIDYEIKLFRTTNKKDFDPVYEIFINFLEEIEKYINPSSTLKKVQQTADGKLYNLKKMKSMFDLKAIGEEIDKKNLKVFVGRYNYWEEEVDKLEARSIYTSNQKQHLIFTDDIKSTRYYSTVNQGTIPPNPYKTFRDSPNHGDIVVNDYNYNSNTFKKFWGSSDFDTRRDEIDDSFLDDVDEILSEIEQSTMHEFAPGWDEHNVDVKHYLGFREKIEELLKKRDQDILEIEGEERALEDQARERDDK